jgi:tRNA U34 5-carboxymethylaminomethyl modifying GTPase MnmE/TrmE
MLLEGLEKWVHRPELVGDVVLLQERHQTEIRKAVEALVRLEEHLQKDEGLEIWAEETKAAVVAVGRVRGRHLDQDAFEDIFSRFCIGK